ncbi:DUF4097 family beta strand repeat-containing protein [Marinilabilia rubra]|uniref:Adhesin domain-containing protein n=1 Tax=Marinilabilia rubra TaxID=2162893 RepID=A0A2U2BD76_9BACT|nr:hypothetical protein [Marinilabilia rubra]PWE01011.1 hypothetical protein DDZ16_00545 [Marinilabilia rubra]
MKTTIIVAIAFLVASYSAQSQSYFEKELKDVRKILIEQIPGTILIKQSEDNSIRIETDREVPKEEDERAEGLRPVNGNIDNTGLGLSLLQSGTNITLTASFQFDNDYHYTVHIPGNLAVSANYTSPFAGKEIDIQSLSNAIEVKTLAADVKFEAITGPAVFHSISGDIEGTFSALSQEAPSSITSVSGLIDIALPPSTGANISLKSITGKIYTGFDITLKKQASASDGRAKGLPQIGGMASETEGSINGGGVNLSIQNISGNIYLRDK